MEKVITWKFIAPNSYIWKERKRMIKPGQMFNAFEKDLPKELRTMVVPFAFVDTAPPAPAKKIFDKVVNFVKPSEPIETPKVEEIDPAIGSVSINEPVPIEFKEHVGKDYPFVEAVPEVDKMQYRIKDRNDGEYWDVLDSNGKIVNEQHLSREEAFDMLKSLRT